MDVHAAQGHWIDVIEESQQLENVTVDADTEIQVSLRVKLAQEQIYRERNRPPGIAPPGSVR
jgi:hypothetical protein